MIIIDKNKNSSHVLVQRKTFIVQVIDPTNDEQIYVVSNQIYKLNWVNSITPTAQYSTLDKVYYPKFVEFIVKAFNEVETPEEVQEKVEDLVSIPNTNLVYCQRELVERGRLGRRVHQRWGGKRIKTKGYQ